MLFVYHSVLSLGSDIMIFSKLLPMLLVLGISHGRLFPMEPPFQDLGLKLEIEAAISMDLLYLLYGEPGPCTYSSQLEKNVFCGNYDAVETLFFVERQVAHEDIIVFKKEQKKQEKEEQQFNQETLDRALAIAVERRHTNIMLLLLGQKADPLSAFYCLVRALKMNGKHVRKNKRLYLQILAVLHERVQVRLIEAIEQADPVAVYILLDAEVDPNGIFAKDHLGRNALVCAARLPNTREKMTLVHLLLKAGAVLDDHYLTEHESVSAVFPEHKRIRELVELIARQVDAKDPTFTRK